MDRGTYIAASGGALQMRKLEVQNNNLANINTIGFKKQYLTAETQEFEHTFASAMGNEAPLARNDHLRSPGVENVQTRTDFTQGPVKETGNPFDVALRNAKDFFVLNTPEGVTYTRAGNFTLNENGEIVTQDGAQVAGDGGAIAVTGVNPSIGDDGSVRAGRETIGRLQVVRIEDPNGLEHVAGTRFKLGAGATQPVPVDAQLIPQAVEMSNVSAISSMVDMIVTNRAFDAYTKAAQAIDTLNQSAIGQVGRRQ